MEIKAAEISSVIKDQIANFETKADVAEVAARRAFVKRGQVRDLVKDKSETQGPLGCNAKLWRINLKK